LQRCKPRQQLLIRKAIENGGRDNIDVILRAISSSGALAYTLARAKRASQAAIAALARVPESIYKDSLLQLAEFAVDRRY
jgi:octaprenyl-diphosphate synthase